MCSDHFHPWSDRQGQSGFAWSWLGAALSATKMSFGVVCAPGQRYHPAIIAQAAATLAEMYPSRFWIAVGSGEALNERITGEGWPAKPARNERLKEAADVMRRLFDGETVSHNGLFKIEKTKLYTRPKEPPTILGAALSPETAEWMGSWADGLITAGSEKSSLEKILQAFRSAGGDRKPVFLQAAVCLAETEDEALALAHHQWRHAALDMQSIADLATPSDFDTAVANVTKEQLRGRLFIATSSQAARKMLAELGELGFDRIYAHPICEDIPAFLRGFQSSLKSAESG